MQEEARLLKDSFRKYAPRGYQPLSAGASPTTPLAIEVMREVGIDISRQRQKIVSEDIELTWIVWIRIPVLLYFFMM